jgi:aminoglycoside 6'-N-acetyltransferase
MGACAVALRQVRGLSVEVVGVARVEAEAGEPVYAAARRAVSGIRTVGERWAVDLSGDPAWFAADVPDAVDVPAGDGGTVPAGARASGVLVGFRPLTRADLPDVVTWQRQPYVARWWQDEAVDVEAAERHYGPALDGTDPTRMWVVELNGRSVGLLQDYSIGDHPDWALLTARPDAVGFDYLLGDPAWVGRGVGTRVLWQYLRDVVRPHYPHAAEFFAAPDHRNVASLRVLDKLGFTRGLWFDEPQPDGRVDTVIGCTLDVPRVLGPAVST